MIIERQSVVDAPAEQVWARVVTPEGINDEVRPWMTMSMPRGAKSLTVDDVPIGETIGRAWLRLFGVVPFDYDRLTIAELVPGRSFDEHASVAPSTQRFPGWRWESRCTRPHYIPTARATAPADTDRRGGFAGAVRAPPPTPAATLRQRLRVAVIDEMA
jgi:hypothetical protein